MASQTLTALAQSRNSHKSWTRELGPFTWNAWKRGLGGATPTQSQVMQQALTIDRQFGQSMVFPR